MVIFLFLRNFWATVIPAVTVPLSLVGTFAVLYALGLQPRQSVADGAVDRGRLRRRRRGRRDREHRPPHRGRPHADGGRAQGRRNRLHHRVDHAVADRRVHSAVPDGRLRRQAVPGIRHHGQRLARPLAGHLADPDADDVRAPAQAPRQAARTALSRFSNAASTALLGVYERGLKIVAAAPFRHPAGHARDDRASPAICTSSFPRASSRSRTPG